MNHLTSLLLLLLLSGCVTVAEKERIEIQPMYGQPDRVRDAFLAREDAAFVKQIQFQYRGDIGRASSDLLRQANGYLRLGDPDGAMRLFNRAWLLDPNDYRVYWGFGQVLVARGSLAEAEHFLDQALARIDDPFQGPALLTDRGTLLSLQGEQLGSSQSEERAALFERANRSFEKAAMLDGAYLPVWQQWARSLFREGEYAAAWDKLGQARRRGVERFSDRFIQALSSRMLPPQGFMETALDPSSDSR